jgi:hypothetical protein
MVGGQAAGRNGRRAQRSATAWSRSKVPFATAVRTFNIICAPRGDQTSCPFPVGKRRPVSPSAMIGGHAGWPGVEPQA